MIFVFAGFACRSNECENMPVTGEDAVSDTLSAWRTWAESSDDGLWCGEKRVNLEYIREFTGEEGDNYFIANDIAINRGKIYITDRCNSRISCINADDGSTLWTFGEPGEGPGHFSFMGHVAVSSSVVYVGNMMNGRIEILSQNGEYVDNIPIMWPYDIILMNDTTLIVMSLSTESIINLYDAGTNEFRRSFGQWETKHEENIMGVPRNLLSCALGDSLIGVASCYESTVRIFNIFTEEMIVEFSRNLPFDPSGGRGRGSVELLDIYAMNDSVLCVLLPHKVTWDKEMLTLDTYDEMAEITVCDRYSINGDYLDSFIFPGCNEVAAVEDSIIIVNSPLSSSVIKYVITEENVD